MAKEVVSARDLSKEFYPKKEGKLGDVRFLNPNGVLSKEVYYSADDYVDGFAKVKLEEGGKVYYRDLIGQVYAEKTEFGKLLYSFFKGEIDANKLSHGDFSNPELENFIVMVINLRHSNDFLNAKDAAGLKVAVDGYMQDPNHKYLEQLKEKAKQTALEAKAKLKKTPPEITTFNKKEPI